MPAGEVGSQGISLGVATAILEIEISQLTRAERALAATIQNIAKSQELLLKGDQALQASAKTTLGILQQQSKVTRGQQGAGNEPRQKAQAAQQEAQAAGQLNAAQRVRLSLTQALVRELNNVAKAQSEVANQTQRELSLVERLAQRRRERSLQNLKLPGSFLGDVLPQPKGGGGFGAGNPNIPTFAQFGLFPFAGLAGSLGATGLQQGILGASSALGVAELGSFRNSIVRLSTQLQGLGGIFGTLATGGAQAATALGATSGGLVASLAAIGTAILPILGVMAGFAVASTLFNTVVAEMERKVTDVSNAIIEFNRQTGQGATSEEIQSQVDEANRTRSGLLISRSELEQILQAGVSGNVSTGQNQRLAQLTNNELTDAGDFVQRTLLSAIIRNLDTEIEGLGATIGTANVQLNSAQVAANDAAAAQDRFTQAQLAAAEATRGLTNAQLQQKIDELTLQYRQINDTLVNTQGLSDDYRRSLFGQLDGIQAQIVAYQELQSPLRDFIISLQQIPQVLKNGIDFLKNLSERREQLGRTLERQAEDDALRDQRQEEDRNRQRLRALEDFGRQERDAEDQFATQRQRVIEDAARADAELLEEAAARRAELIEDANEREQELEEDHQRRIAKILRDGRTRILEAAARLDARGVLETQRRLKDQIAEENERRDEAREDLQERLAEQLADLEENLEEQRRRRAEDLQRRLQEMDREFAIQQQRRRDDFIRRLQQEDQERVLQDQREAQDRALRRQRQLQDYQRETNDQLQHYFNLAQIQRNGLDFLRQGWQNFFTDAARTAQQAPFNRPFTDFVTGQFSNSRGGGGGSPRFITPFAQGIGRVPNDMIAALHAGERVLTPLQNAEYQRGGRGTVIVNINGDLGNNAAPAVRDAAEQGVEAAMERWMWNFIGEGMNDLNGGR